MKMLPTRAGIIRLLCLVALAGTLYKGFMKTPEAASNLTPQRFFNGLVGDGENTAIMKERHRDINEALDKAIRVRLGELRTGLYRPAPGSLVTEQSLERAIRKDQATRERADDDVLRAGEKLDRAKRLEAQGWRMGIFSCAGSKEARP
jgi:hypothetical protein